MQSDSGRNVNILGVDSIDNFERENSSYERATEIKLFESPDR
jgi:hypothetical protein